MATYTSFGVLIRLAKEEAKAKRNGTKEQIEAASKAHEDYRQLCLKSDGMLVDNLRYHS